jgi:hypothetical protein
MISQNSVRTFETPSSKSDVYHFICSESRPCLDLPGAWGELLSAAGTVEVVGVVHVAAEAERFLCVDGKTGEKSLISTSLDI